MLRGMPHAGAADVLHMLALIDTGTAGSLRMLARQMNRHEDDLSKAFRRHTGIGVRAYISRRRVEAAANAIRRGEKVEAVALEAGFRSKKNFYIQFRRRFGMTPGAFRDGTARRPPQRRA
jgi:AraC family transcriptional regulator, regulatory protein of adaptative response / methylated-DNA-[protein]-cysteine methyltransferase